MARPEYTPARRVMMQIVLCIILALTSGLAWWMGRLHAKALRAPLGPVQSFPNSIMSLDLRLPEGWSVDVQPRINLILLKETHPPFGSQREMVIIVQRAGRQSTPQDVADANHPGRRVAKSQRFDFLSSRGLLVEYLREPVPDDPTKIQKPVVYACTVVANRRAEVTIEIVGPSDLAPADAEVVKSVALAMSPMDAKHPAPLVTSTIVSAPAEKEPPADGDSD